MYDEDTMMSPEDAMEAQPGGGMPWGAMGAGGAMGAALLGATPVGRAGLRSAAGLMGRVPKAGPMMQRGMEGMARGGDMAAEGIERGMMATGNALEPAMRGIRSGLEQGGAIAQRAGGAMKNMMQRGPSADKFSMAAEGVSGTTKTVLRDAANITKALERSKGKASAVDAKVSDRFLKNLSKLGQSPLAKRAQQGDKEAQSLLQELQSIAGALGPA